MVSDLGDLFDVAYGDFTRTAEELNRALKELMEAADDLIRALYNLGFTTIEPSRQTVNSFSDYLVPPFDGGTKQKRSVARENTMTDTPENSAVSEPVDDTSAPENTRPAESEDTVIPTQPAESGTTKLFPSRPMRKTRKIPPNRPMRKIPKIPETMKSRATKTNLSLR